MLLLECVRLYCLVSVTQKAAVLTHAAKHCSLRSSNTQLYSIDNTIMTEELNEYATCTIANKIVHLQCQYILHIRYYYH
jgi:hypothetical protein